MLIQRATLLGGTVVDIRLGPSITEVADELAPKRGEDVLDAAYGAVIPGLHDHHVHLRSAAAALDSVQLGPPHVQSRNEFVRALTSAAPDADGWIRAVGYHESVAGPLDRAQLDAIMPTIPVRVQHRSGALWIVNSVGLTRIGITEHPDGRLLRIDGGWTDGGPRARRGSSLHRISQRLVGFGVTGVTDATPGKRPDDVKSLAAARRSGELRQRLHCMADPDVDEPVDITIGPVKIILEEDALDLRQLENVVRRCHSLDRGIAVHCVTESQLVVTIAALQAVGIHPLDRIEHAAMVPDDSLDDLTALGITVVTQPNFVAERGDAYLTQIAADERHQLWRLRSLLSHKINVALSTDMPFGDGDPWAAMRAAVHRRTPGGASISPGECISPTTAVTMFLGRPDRPAESRAVQPGQPGDLCVLAAAPHEVLAELDSAMVRATIIAGQIA
jgi:predicted amidohydrolase YtcJ